MIRYVTSDNVLPRCLRAGTRVACRR